MSTPTDTATPVKIRRLEERGMALSWSDGTEVTLPSELLRRACPCAECRELAGDTSHAKPLSGAPVKRSMLAVIDASLAEQTKLMRVWAVGGYAVGMEWGDRHGSGIYTYELLRELTAAVLNVGTA